ncbi:MAG: 2-amino-4-hydroxy-6-hydroxymethyldihydropteridine diphosphokinase [Clostridium sp.]|nr:2-amino-4-hydroxy-6-hydroxymethyldihydropteridine diphosphokinase [Prevotella sp.]MCM1429731.1 2-amino-4-hydroxy-6-hydroxymethyldihydropteridine diphosphokinase [Clostridium sp.]MCM1476204.1 2-amino-4-hydroxy-6-hydroxymethyldihydropteridine diphosphokinase [Muribaculaceae bacterium]
MYAFINIGSNLGNRRLNLSRAVAEIEKLVGFFELSHTVETMPWGYVSDKRFLNVGMAFQTDMTPLELLDALQEIERRINQSPHRDASNAYADRELDIDIMALDDMVIDTPRLQIPHPRLAERSFFLEPLKELAPAWRHPVSGLSPMEMLLNLDSQSSKK